VSVLRHIYTVFPAQDLWNSDTDLNPTLAVDSLLGSLADVRAPTPPTSNAAIA